MDVQRFRDSRASELSEFQKQYNLLKTQYSTALSAAIQESDPASQQDLIQQVLSANASMTSEVRSILAKLHQGSQGFEPKELNQLTADLIQYQKDYADLEQSKDKVNTLKRIRDTNSQKLASATTMYSIYIAIVIALTFLVAYLVFKTEWGRRVLSTLPTIQSQ